MPYEATTVPIEKTQRALETILRKHGATKTRYTHLVSESIVEFARPNKETGGEIPYRMKVHPPDRLRKRESTVAGIARLERQTWRMAYWKLKADLEAVEFGLVSFEEALLPLMLIARENGQGTVADMLMPRLSAGMLRSSDDPFGPLRPMLKAPEGQDDRR